MKLKDFYSFDSKLSSKTIQVHSVGLNNLKFANNLAAEWNLILGLYDGIQLPVVFKQEYGKKLEDILDTGWPGLFLVSKKFKEVLEENALTGWKTFDVKVLDKNNQELQGFYGLSITGKCGKIDYSKSEIIEKRLVPNGPVGKYYKGLPIGLDEWDGSDFFLPHNNFGAIVTSKVADVLKKSKVTNVRFENLTDIETPDFALQKA
ncbi:MAG: hypothetical protein EAZ53_17250 [Bacteroidetes bacterium]|nr:MAG: hypothetical protein EAZ53_17250 [Bacteroidota bacterium]